MKLLVIGIDGGTYDIFSQMEMPFLNNFFNDNIQLDLEEDLWSRGWAEILNGKHGCETGAFYYKPVHGNPSLTTSHFGPENHEQPGLKPLWKILPERGYKVGLLNIPTTMPAPPVDGFCISGAGAGFNPRFGLKPEACFPADTYTYLSGIDYAWQIRFMSSGIKEIDPFFNAIETIIKKRTDAFIHFAQQYQIDFGFIVHTENNPIQNVCMYEIQELLQNLRNPQTKLQNRILCFYPCLDASLRRLLEHLQPENVIVVSDHGSAPRKFSVNLNAFLVEIGLQQKLYEGKERRLLRNLKKHIPVAIRRFVKKTAPTLASNLNKLNIDVESSKAFTQRYIPGIYINDGERFNGPVSSAIDRRNLIDHIIDRFNASALHQVHQLTALPVPGQFRDCNCKDIIPDIWVQKPPGVFFEGDGPILVRNQNYRRIKSLCDVSQDLYQGIKGNPPLACVDRQLKRFINNSDDRNLTQIYNIICRTMEGV